jgi:hypothetical protein
MLLNDLGGRLNQERVCPSTRYVLGRFDRKERGWLIGQCTGDEGRMRLPSMLLQNHRRDLSGAHERSRRQ